MNTLKAIVVLLGTTTVIGCAHNPNAVNLANDEQRSRVYSIEDQLVSPLNDIYASQNNIVYLLDSANTSSSHVSVNDEVSINVMRLGRYKLVQTAPAFSQVNLLAQPVTVNVSVSEPLGEVGHALASAIESTGFTMCDTPEVLGSLYKMPLPRVHYHMGPMSLIETVQVIIGPGWEVFVDQTNRDLCFKPHKTTAAIGVVEDNINNDSLGAVPVEPSKIRTDFFENKSIAF